MSQVVAGGSLGQVLKEGQVLADDGAIYTTVQEAENAASDWIRIGPGTFSEAVTIDTAGLAVYGSGRDTLIDGGTTGHAIEVTAADVLIQDLSVETTGGGGNSFDGVLISADGCIVNTVWVRDADREGIRNGSGSDCLIIGCIGEASDLNMINTATSTSRVVIMGCVVEDGSNNGIGVFGDDCLVAGCEVSGVSSSGIVLAANDGVATGNRVHNVGDHGIEIVSGDTDNVVANNRISGSTNADIDDNGTDTLLHGNRTGAAN